MKILLLGPPGSGKGTQAKLLAKRLQVPHISTGDILREAIRVATPLGAKAKQYMDKGEYVPDDVMIEIVEERLRQQDAKAGFILDGFPRTVPQAEALKKITKLEHTILLDVPDLEIVSRLSARRSCDKCGGVFHLVSHPPKKEGVCDNCGGRLAQRSDDTGEVIKKRLEVYHRQTDPLVDYYKDSSESFMNVDASRNPDLILSDILQSLRESA